MNENENLVLDEGTENVEATATEEMVEQVTEPEKIYTEEEFNNKLNEVSGKRASRKEAKLRKEYDRKYGGLIDVLKAGTGIDDVEELTTNLKDFYSKRGVEIKQTPTYSEKETEVLAKAEADEIIKWGYEDVVEEVDRLAAIGIEKMSAKDKAVFKTLADYRERTEKSNELAKIGVKEDVLNSDEFKDFASQFNSKTPITKIYEIYNKTKPKKEIKTMGSMKDTTGNASQLKDFYTPEEAKRFTVKDLDENPRLLGILEESMKKWKNNAS
jgi:hypothetical protein